MFVVRIKKTDERIRLTYREGKMLAHSKMNGDSLFHVERLNRFIDPFEVAEIMDAGNRWMVYLVDPEDPKNEKDPSRPRWFFYARYVEKISDGTLFETEEYYDHRVVNEENRWREIPRGWKREIAREEEVVEGGWDVKEISPSVGRLFKLLENDTTETKRVVSATGRDARGTKAKLEQQLIASLSEKAETLLRKRPAGGDGKERPIRKPADKK